MTNYERAQASRARLEQRSAPTYDDDRKYPGSRAMEALRAIGFLDLLGGIGLGVYLLTQDTGVAGLVVIISSILSCAVLFALAAIVENLIAIRKNTES